MTQATIKALEGLRDPSTIKWYAIPLLAIVLYVYAREIKEAKQTGNWDAVLAGLTLFGMDFFNETCNGWIMHLTRRSALWTTPGDTALRVMVGWNIEIIFMFLLAGIIYYHCLSEEKTLTILKIPEIWFWSIATSAFCVLVECLLNAGGQLVWEYSFWNRSFFGVWLIFLLGYFTFFCAINLVITRKTMRAKLSILGVIYAVPVIMNVLALGILGWNY
ncbi:MAG: hypothetical protein B5M56_02555 [Desulfococcus sp. 4484_241]|nr:MAG: hypothetical protein B5M56_02555 [Desulfococcus sp. 4484_241]